MSLHCELAQSRNVSNRAIADDLISAAEMSAPGKVKKATPNAPATHVTAALVARGMSPEIAARLSEKEAWGALLQPAAAPKPDDTFPGLPRLAADARDSQLADAPRELAGLCEAIVAVYNLSLAKSVFDRLSAYGADLFAPSLVRATAETIGAACGLDLQSAVRLLPRTVLTIVRGREIGFAGAERFILRPRIADLSQLRTYVGDDLAGLTTEECFSVAANATMHAALVDEIAQRLPTLSDFVASLADSGIVYSALTKHVVGDVVDMRLRIAHVFADAFQGMRERDVYPSIPTTRIQDDLEQVIRLQRKIPTLPRRSWNLRQPFLEFFEPSGEDGALVRRGVLIEEDVFRHIAIFGQTGSGKSVTVTREITANILKRGWGALVTCYSDQVRKDWTSLARQFGREEDLIVISLRPGQRLRFNFCQTLIEDAISSNDTLSAASDVLAICDIVRNGSFEAASAGGNEPFFRMQMETLLQRSIGLYMLSGLPFSFESLSNMLTSLPETRAIAQSPKWRHESQCAFMLEVAQRRIAREVGSPDYTRKSHTLAVVRRYFLEEFAALAPNTRSCVDAELKNALSRFISSPDLQELLNTTTEITPEVLLRGKIVVLDVPIGSNAAVGQPLAAVWKSMTNRTLLKRGEVSDVTTPVIQVNDEQQFTMAASYDQKMMSVIRKMRGAVISVFNSVGQPRAICGSDAAGDAFLGNYSTQIVLQVGCPSTLQLFAKRAGERCNWRRSSNSSRTMTFGTGGLSSNVGESISASREPRVDPVRFGLLHGCRDEDGHRYSEAYVFPPGGIPLSYEELRAENPQSILSDDQLEAEIAKGGNATIDLARTYTLVRFPYVEV